MKDAIDVEYENIENIIYLTAPQLAQKINDTDIRVRHWADVFGDLIGIEKINGRKRYKESDVYKFAFIKDLLDNKNFKHDQARVYLSKHGFKYAEYNSGLVDTNDPLGFQALASALSVEVNEKFKIIANEIMKNVSNQLEEYLQIQKQINLETKAELESAIDELVTDKLSELSSTIIKQNENIIEAVNFKIDGVEQQNTKRDVEMIDKMKSLMDKHKQEYEENLKNQQGKKGIFSKFFKHK